MRYKLAWPRKEKKMASMSICHAITAPPVTKQQFRGVLRLEPLGQTQQRRPREVVDREGRRLPDVVSGPGSHPRRDRSPQILSERLQALDHIPGVVRQRRNARRLLVEMMSVRRRERGVGDEFRVDSRPGRLGGRSLKRRLRLRRIRRLWLNSVGGVKQESDSGRGQACIKFQHDGGLPNFPFILGISEPPITTLSDPRGHHAFTRALLLAGLELPCDAGRLQCRSSIKRGERRGGIASGPAVDAGLLLVGGESAAGLLPTLVDVCRV